MTTRTKVLLTVALVGLLVVLTACWSTACMSNAELLDFVNGATPVPCWP